MSEPTEIDRDACGLAIIASGEYLNRYNVSDVLTDDTKARLLQAHRSRRAAGEGLMFGDELDQTILGFVQQDCGEVLDAYLHVSGRVWTEDADGWVCDCTGVEIEVRA